MVRFEHEQLIKRLAKAEEPPNDDESFRAWIRGRAHLEFLQRNAQEDEIIVAALSPAQTCINSFVASADHPDLHGDVVAMERWSPSPFEHGAATYSWSWGPDGVHPVSRDDSPWNDLPPDVRPLVFGRGLDGIPGRDGVHYEIAQEYTHVSDIHWQPKRRAYSRFDHRGDWLDVVSVSERGESYYADIVSFRREDLDLHLIAMNAVLVQVFDFSLRRSDQVPTLDYSDHIDRTVHVNPGVIYREMINEDNFGFIRGVQVVQPKLTSGEIESLVKTGRIPDSKESDPVEFTVHDLRGGGIVDVSTDPKTTTNYFEKHKNTLPYEMSPASFRPEVLSRYNADSEKYTVEEDRIYCRESWYLRRYWVNEAGQVSAYICDLRNLPYEEQVHWSIHNEDPKAGIPDHVFKADFLGQVLDEGDIPPVVSLRELLRRWRQEGVRWWAWKARRSLDHLAAPRTGSRDEWMDECLELSNGVVEGFGLDVIRARLTELGGEYKSEERSILLLERVLRLCRLVGGEGRVAALWEVNDLRVHGKSHAAGSKGQQISDAALRDHGSYAAHFEDLCTRLVAELKMIEEAFR